MKFFNSKSDEELIYHENGTLSERYAWCLNELNNQLRGSVVKADIKHSLNIFKKNMQERADTKKLFQQVENQYYSFLDNEELLHTNDDYIFKCFSGIDLSGHYLYCTP